jgi:serine/threonine protein kinase
VSAISLPIVAILGLLAAAAVTLFAAFKLIGLVFWIVGGALTLALHTVRDALRIASSIITCFFLIARITVSVILGRWSAAKHHGQRLETEIVRGFRSLYQATLGNLIEFFDRPVAGQPVVAIKPDLEDDRSAPQVHGAMPQLSGRNLRKQVQQQARAEHRAKHQSLHTPGPDSPSKGNGFEGYQVVGSLPTGGSGAKIYVANPTEQKRKALARAGNPTDGQVVIKCFTLDEGSNLSQIVRESRALESAKKLGMVLEHGLDERRYFYVMPYVPGENMSLVGQRMHAAAGSAGLNTKQHKRVMAYMADLLAVLDRFHKGGLWHKDVKPDNIIVRDDRAYLVDLGLVTPLASAMTLTTHGTEYFRDPELVRQALRGAKVHEVDGARFDLYGAGAVLYSLLEDSFPAHGSLSTINKRCPEPVKWIVRRSMADLGSRYANAREMLADIRAVQAAEDPFAMKPADLPSMGGRAPELTLLPPPPVPTYQPGPKTAAYAAASIHKMPPPVPASAREHALAAARQARLAARSARKAARHARQNAKDGLRRGACAFAEQREHLHNIRKEFTAKSAALTESFRSKNFAKAKVKAKPFQSGKGWGVFVGLFAGVMLVAVAALAINEEMEADRRRDIWRRNQALQAEAIQIDGKGSAQNGVIIGSAPKPGVEYTFFSSSDHGVETRSATASAKTVSATPAASTRPSFRLVHSEEAAISANRLDANGSQFEFAGSGALVEAGKGRILVLDELSRSSSVHHEQMSGLISQLRKEGYSVLGATGSLEIEDQEAEVELLAQARSALGLYKPSDPDSRNQLKAFLSEHAEIDAVLWCGPVGEDQAANAYLLHQGDYSAHGIVEILSGK